MSSRSVSALVFILATGLAAGTEAASQQAPGGWDRPPGTAIGGAAATGIRVSAQGLPGLSNPVTFSEPEFPLNTVINGFSVSTLNGVTIPPLSFTFTVAGVGSTDCHVLGGPGNEYYVQGVGIEGTSAGVLTIDLGIDVTVVSLGFAQSCPPASPGIAMTAYSAGGATVGTAAAPGINTGYTFAENRLVFSSNDPFRRIQLSFPTPGGCSRFLVDNLAYGAGAAVPATSNVGLALLGVLLLGGGAVLLWSRRRRETAA